MSDDALPPRTTGERHTAYVLKPDRSPLRLVATDLIIFGLILAWLSFWTTLLVCLISSAYIRMRRIPQFQPAVAIINEAIASNGHVALANFIAPVSPATKYRWVQTSTGTIPVEEP